MAFIKFNKSSTKAAATSTAAKTDNTVYFPTDEKAIYLNGQKYGENLGLTQTPAQVQTLLDKVEGMVYVTCDSLDSDRDKILPDSVKLIDGNIIIVQFVDGNANYDPYLVAGSYRKNVDGYIKWDKYAKVFFYISGDYAHVLNTIIEGTTSIPSGNDTRLITSKGVYDYFVPKLIIPLNNYVDIIYEEDIKSQIINMNGNIGIVNSWRGLIRRGASPQIVIDIEDGEHTFYINSVVVDNPWYPNEDDGSDFITLSFYLNDRYVSLEFYVPADDPGGGSGS